MNTKALATHYATLTAEERFWLIVAAHDRGDEAEADRLESAAKRELFSNTDYSPYAHALQELALLTFLELAEGAAKHDDARQRLSDADMGDFIDGKKPKRGADKDDGPTMRDRLFQMFLAEGFILKTKAAAWKLFCERMGIAPFGLWQHLPGFERLQRALNIVEGSPDRPGPAFTRAGMVKWLNRNRPDGEPERTEADILDPENYADESEGLFRDRAKLYGAE